MRIKHRIMGVLAASLLLAGSAAAGPTDAEKCEADKLKRAGKYAFCRMKAESKAVKKGEAPDYTKCDTKIVDKFGKADARYGMECPTAGDVGGIQMQVTGDTDDLAVVLSGGTLRFEDTGLTVIDHQTGLEWEKKTGTLGPDPTLEHCPGGPNCGDVHNANNRYTWSDSGTFFDGGVQTLFLDVLNDVVGGGASCFAGHCDWRLPTVAKPDDFGVVQEGEFESIIDCSGGPPCIDGAFGPAVVGDYWSSTSTAGDPAGAWRVGFNIGDVRHGEKAGGEHLRAVRSGL